ncbi:MAG: helix-turn-helix transcriptional regulator [Flavobacteriaceae bacterium]|nr:helix-turn-helix transcriptional regulator [Bacteroidia bacterium]NNK88432.1 helix-turn-helix transcriptional regulator [Flavobacteriaceae bacterium]
MVNSKKFSIRLKQIMDFYGLSASALSETIGVQRSSISHILSGRNKPSLDFVMKLLNHFKEVDLYWLLNGEGSFPSEESKPIQKHMNADLSLPKTHSEDPSIERIIICYKDGSFREYSN